MNKVGSTTNRFDDRRKGDRGNMQTKNSAADNNCYVLFAKRFRCAPLHSDFIDLVDKHQRGICCLITGRARYTWSVLIENGCKVAIRADHYLWCLTLIPNTSESFGQEAYNCL
jgi:hypothetical protein